MNKLRRTPFKTMVMLLCLITIGAFGQKQTRTFNETFTVADESVLDVNTSHTDIEFETWNKNQVEIEAIIEIEGASDEEAVEYFENSGFEILGNSKKVAIKTGVENRWFFSQAVGDARDFRFEIPEIPEIPELESFDFDFEFDFEELKNMPPLPMNTAVAFDHEAFEKDGEKYLKKWQKEFVKGYDKEHIKEIEDWRERMEVRQLEIQKKREAVAKERANMNNDRLKKMTKTHEKRFKAHNERLVEIYKKGRSGLDSNDVFLLHSKSSRKPNIFYSSSKGLNKNYKVKKTLKVKMPKSMKIKMNVRHGEVKLAENTKNINATLSHSSLLAATIDGDKTIINASYSPVSVLRWNYGQLQANYSKKVDLKRVINLRLNANSSDVTIDNLDARAFIKNDFGPLHIKSIGKNFKEIDISLQNADLNFKTPKVPFTIYVNGTSSKFTCPSDINLNKTKNGASTINKGFLGNENANGSVVIHSKYSDVVFYE